MNEYTPKCKINNNRNKNKINVLFVAHDPNLSGASLSLLSLLSAIDRKVFSPYVIVPRQGRLEDEIKRLDIPVYIEYIRHWIPFSDQWGLKNLLYFLLGFKERAWAISRLIEKNKIDVVYTNTVTVIDAAVAAYITKTPHIWHAREYIKGNKDIKPYMPNIFVPLIMNLLSHYIIVNSDSLEKCIKLNNFFRKIIPSKPLECNITTIYNGTDYHKVTFLDSNCDNIRDQYKISSSTKLVSYVVSKLTERKDALTFIRAAKLIKDSVNDVAFIIVGSGDDDSYMEKINELVNDLNLQKDIFFLGTRKDIPNIMRTTDVLTLTSEQEAFGKVIIEAMAAGKPVVATKSGGPEEIVIDGITGFLTPVKDEKTIAEKVVFLLTNPEKASYMGQQGLIRVQSLYSMEKYVESIENVIIKTIKTL